MTCREAPADRIPEWRVARLVHHSAKLGQHHIAETWAMLFDKQIAGSGEQHAKAACPLLRMKEQPADFARSFEIGSEVERLVAEDPAQLLALHRQGRDQIAEEGAVGAD